jgi:hypothetical protein
MVALLRLVSVIASLVVILSFVLFAIDESNAASSASTRAIAGASSDPAPSAHEEVVRERAHSKPREAIDDADDVLLRPFAWAADGSSSRWVRKGIPTLLALLIYGFALSFLIRMVRIRA